MDVNGNRIVKVKDAEEDRDAMNKRTTEALLLTKVSKTGDSMTGELDITAGQGLTESALTVKGELSVKSGLTSVSVFKANAEHARYMLAPKEDFDVANKQYVDEQISSVDVSDQLKGYMKNDGDVVSGNYDFDKVSADGLIRVNGDVVIKDKDQSISQSNLIGIYQKTQRVQYWGKIDDDLCIVTKEYVDSKFGGFTPGDPVAKKGSESSPGGFYESGGNLFYKSY